MKTKYIAVITGDIINSTKYDLETRDNLRNILSITISNRLTSYFSKNVIPQHINVFRGDSWQVIITKPSLSLRISLLIRCLLKISLMSNSINTRMAIGIGAVESPLKDINNGDGEAYILSGKGLDKLTSSESSLSISISKSFDFTQNLNGLLKNNFQLIDLISSNWTFKQCKAMEGMLLNKTTQEIANDWFGKKINRSAVSRHLYKAGWNTISENISFFEKTLFPQ